MKKNDNYKKDLQEIKESFKLLKKLDKKVSWDIQLHALDVIKGIHDSAIKEGIDPKDIQYLINYYNTQQKRISRIKKKTKHISKLEKKINSLFNSENLEDNK